MKVAQHVLNLIDKDLAGTAHEGEALSVYTHFLSTGEKFLHVKGSTYEEISKEGWFLGAKNAPKFRFIDLFAGIGGFRLGLQNHGGKAVFSSEWDRQARETYFKNHRDYPFGDINFFTNEDVSDNELQGLIPDHDVLAAGFPCQPFSKAGVSARLARGLAHGFECKTQGTLFFSIERIARVKRPKILFLENVKNLVGHDKGQTFEIIKESIESLGYKFFWQLMDSQTLVPQRRIRCFMIAVEESLAGERGDFCFPKLPEDPIPLSSALDTNPDPSYTISERLWEGHQKRTKRNRERGVGFTALVADVTKPSNTIVARYGKDGKECLVPQTDKPPRYLTIPECRRLFGYPETFVLPNKRTPAYRLLGNSVVLPVVDKLAAAIAQQYLS